MNVLQSSIGVQGNNIGVNQVGKVPAGIPVVQKPIVDNFQNGAKTTTPINPSLARNLNNLYAPNQLLAAYTNPIYANTLLANSQSAKDILASHGIEAKVYPENLTKTTKAHIQTTTACAMQIANKLNLSLADKKVLELGCVFHDYGKIFIPSEILNKPGSFTPQEKEIMDLHAQLGAETLKATGMNKRVLDLVANHHKPVSEVTDILGQILSVADIYSALREQRSYKEPLTNAQAMQILDQKAQAGEVSTEVVNALKACVSEAMVA